MIALAWTRTDAARLVAVVAFWVLATGLLELLAARRLRPYLQGSGMLGWSGGSSVLLALAILFWPTSDVGVLVRLLSAYGFAFGAVLLLRAGRMRRQLR